MKRRDFLALTAAGLIAAPLAAHAAAPVEYTPGMVKKDLAEGKTVFLDFHATWCSTCAAQKRVIDKLRASNPAYDKSINFVVVDWDTYRHAAIARKLDVTHRATLIVLKGDKTLGRLNWETREPEIKGLMDKALDAAANT